MGEKLCEIHHVRLARIPNWETDICPVCVAQLGDEGLEG